MNSLVSFSFAAYARAVFGARFLHQIPDSVKIYILVALLVIILAVLLYDPIVNGEERRERKKKAKEDRDLYNSTRTGYDVYRDYDESEAYQREVRRLRENGGQPLRSLEIKGVKLRRLPFVPYRPEVIYVEDTYRPEANQFICEHYDLICKCFWEKGFRFVYLPRVKPEPELLKRTYECVAREAMDPETQKQLEAQNSSPLSSSFLLDYMVHPENKSLFHSGFAWYNTTLLEEHREPAAVYTVIVFDGEEALAHPMWMIEKICRNLGYNDIFGGGLYSKAKICPSEDRFGEEAVKMLENVRAELEKLRLMGVSESMITQYVKPATKLSRLTVTSDLRILLTDWNVEVKMEPLNKAVYLLFLRHPEGIRFKDLADYRYELDVIYAAVRAHKNNIDEFMKQQLVLPPASKGVENVTNPLHNAINEKCARIREAFLLVMYEGLTDNYAVTGLWGEPKGIRLPSNMVTWE